MSIRRSFLTLALSAAAAAPLLAQQPTGVFVVRLGRDTTAVEKYTRTGNRIEVDGFFRQPRTTLRHAVIEMANEKATRVEVTTSAPGAAANAPGTQRITSTFRADSIITEVRRDTVVQTRRVANVAAGATPVLGGASSSWVGLELVALKLKGCRCDSTAVTMYGGGTATATFAAKTMMSRDSIWLYDGNDVFHAKVDANGRIMGAIPMSGTQQFTVERVANADINALATAFAARDAQGQNLGLLSPRDTVRSSVGGASLWVDYSRPALRGRTIYGSNVVPWGAVWRTGANAATQFRTDKALDIGGVTLPAGMYTLWTIPQQSGGWKLLINSQTGQWGTDHDATKDLFQLDMTTSSLPQPVERFTVAIVPGGQGGTLNFDWQTTRASIPFTVRN